MAEELAVITRTYDLLVWTLNHTGKFPRSHRHTLGAHLEEKLYDLLDRLVEAKYTSDKSEILRKAALRVEQLRLLYRVAKDLKFLASNSHGHASRGLHEIGRQLGAWRKKVERR
jgi:hypothetical protein